MVADDQGGECEGGLNCKTAKTPWSSLRTQGSITPVICYYGRSLPSALHREAAAYGSLRWQGRPDGG